MRAYADKSAVIIGNLLNLICAVAMIFIPIVLFPVAKKFNQDLAQAYVVFRFLEGILFIYMAIKSLTFISLSKSYGAAGDQDAAFYRILGSSVHEDLHWATIIYILVFIFGAVAFYSLLFRSKLVPRFLSVWGLLAIVLMLTGVLMAIFGWGIFNSAPLMKGMVWFAPPIALNELVLSIWLIIRGFNLSEISAISAKQT